MKDAEQQDTDLTDFGFQKVATEEKAQKVARRRTVSSPLNRPALSVAPDMPLCQRCSVFKALGRVCEARNASQSILKTGAIDRPTQGSEQSATGPNTDRRLLNRSRSFQTGIQPGAAMAMPPHNMECILNKSEPPRR